MTGVKDTPYYELSLTEPVFEFGQQPIPSFEQVLFVMGGTPDDSLESREVKAARSVGYMMDRIVPSLVGFELGMTIMTPGEQRDYENNPAPVENQQVFLDGTFAAITQIRYVGRDLEEFDQKHLILTRAEEARYGK